ncbi:hypothetical protein SCA6_011300, partial [Theobroma cacao]
AKSNENMEKIKKVSLGVQKKTKATKQSKKKFLNIVLDYLKSYCYMFTPLISPHLSTRMRMMGRVHSCTRKDKVI